MKVEWWPHYPQDFHGCTRQQFRTHVDLLYDGLAKTKLATSKLSTILSPTGQLTIECADLAHAKEFAAEVVKLEAIIRDPELFTLSIVHDS